MAVKLQETCAQWHARIVKKAKDKAERQAQYNADAERRRQEKDLRLNETYAKERREMAGMRGPMQSRPMSGKSMLPLMAMMALAVGGISGSGPHGKSE